MPGHICPKWKMGTQATTSVDAKCTSILLFYGCFIVSSKSWICQSGALQLGAVLAAEKDKAYTYISSWQRPSQEVDKGC